jgi:N-dimethylarginine dimethylaminohydrolase
MSFFTVSSLGAGELTPEYCVNHDWVDTPSMAYRLRVRFADLQPIEGAKMARPAVLMSDPRYFDIRGGVNPHTRDAEGRKKSVDRDRALDQWHGYVDTLLDAGVDVYVVPPKPELSGMVFAANAGFLHGRPSQTPLRTKTFFPSHFTAEHRRGESDRFRRFMNRMGCQTESCPDDLKFEGEADAFPVAGEWVFTYGFRSEPGTQMWLEDRTDREFIGLELADPAYYHGDCLICDIGDAGLAWLGGLVDEDAERFRQLMGDRLVELSDDEAATFVGNSFYVANNGQRYLFTVDNVPASLSERLEDAGLTVVPVDVSEMFGKGGGGPKCMVFNLGGVARHDEDCSDEVNRFREAHRADRLRANGELPTA